VASFVVLGPRMLTSFDQLRNENAVTDFER
jgi:hypothetical protein